MSDERDWRTWAYLRIEHWPEAVPEMGPKREYGPYPWGEKQHDDPLDLDDYPNSHPNAASVGQVFMGDVCPYCGKPLSWDGEVVLLESGDTGVFHEISEIDNPEPAYHTGCWGKRECERGDLEYATFAEFEI